MFITFEGPDGSGKSTVIKAVYERLINDGYSVILTREPGGTPIAEKIRDVILDNSNTALDARTEALLYAASRRQHLVEKIWPAIKEGKIVLCDRFLDSSLAYQGEGRKLGIENILNVNLFATENTYPDLTLFFNISPEEGLKRVSKDKKRVADRLDNENANFHQEVYNGFLKVNSMYKDRIQVIDATKSLNEVIENAYKIIKSKLEN
ncbi:MAG: dTMP kinase [Candidatus Onthovivens sp.]|nr:dTMP kinase [bacterium]MDD7616499.1 dTMP kinase [bacterium]MDY4159721.1 dTMP kinase [Candidatus Onthovivens sp.]